MTKRLKLDKKDKQILKILPENGRITNAQLAIDVGLSPAPTLKRVKKLEKSAVIESYDAKLNHAAIGPGVSTFVKVNLKSPNNEAITRFANDMQKINEVIECHHTTGTEDFMLKVVTKDIPSYQELMLENITEILEINEIESVVVLSTLKDNRTVTVP